MKLNFYVTEITQCPFSLQSLASRKSFHFGPSQHQSLSANHSPKLGTRRKWRFLTLILPLFLASCAGNIGVNSTQDYRKDVDDTYSRVGNTSEMTVPNFGNGFQERLNSPLVVPSSQQTDITQLKVGCPLTSGRSPTTVFICFQDACILPERSRKRFESDTQNGSTEEDSTYLNDKPISSSITASAPMEASFGN